MGMIEHAGGAGSAAALEDEITDEDKTELELEGTKVLVIEAGIEEELLLCPTLEDETKDEDTTKLELDEVVVLVEEARLEEELLVCPMLEETLEEEPEVASVDEILELDFTGLQ